MKFTELTVLLPCHSLEDFPVYHEGTPADELLAAWCALWHPALIASAERAPTWHRIDVAPENLTGRLLTVPPFCIDRLPAGFVARAKNDGALLIKQPTCDDAIRAALDGLGSDAPAVDPEIAADFVALGFCRLHIELLTRQMRYSTNIDEAHFETQVVSAAQAALNGNLDAARGHLQQCFDTLYEARKHFYPVDNYLLDLTLLAPSTLGNSLERELQQGSPINLQLPADLLTVLAQDQQLWPRVLSAIDHGLVCILGDEDQERELPLLPIESVLASVAAGSAIYEQHLGRRPKVFARRRAGLTPLLPQILSKLGYESALHFTLDDGRFPLGPQCKTRWEGLDSSVVDILARVPSDAARPETFLGLSRRLADSMDSDHVATLAFAHWPGAVSPWYATLRRVARMSPALGKFMLLDDYFSHTDMPGRLSKFEADEYRAPYLKQAVIRRQPDPISTTIRAHQTMAQQAATEAVQALTSFTTGRMPMAESDGNAARAIASLSQALTREAAGGAGHLVVNTLSFARRMGVELAPGTQVAAAQPGVIAAGSAGPRSFAVVDVPAMGFAWIQSGAASAAGKTKPIAQDNVLRNEFFEVAVSRGTGGIQSLYNFRQRGNQLSQQIAFRLPSVGGEPVSYTTMRAESIETTLATPAVGEIVSRGGLFDPAERRLAGFQQVTRVWAGRRTIEIEIDIDEPGELRADPWNSYYAVRFAWPDETTSLWRGVGLTSQPTEAQRLEAPEFITLETAGGQLTLLTGGLPYHRRSDTRMLDSLLIVRGETQRHFRLGIAVDAPQPAAAALDFLTAPVVVPGMGRQSASPSGWLFHLDAKHVVATHWQPLAAEAPPSELTAQSPTAAQGAGVRGFRARFLETGGRSGRVTLRTFRGVAAARQVDFLGQTVLQLRVDNDQVTLDFAAHEWIEVEVLWS